MKLSEAFLVFIAGKALSVYRGGQEKKRKTKSQNPNSKRNQLGNYITSTKNNYSASLTNITTFINGFFFGPINKKNILVRATYISHVCYYYQNSMIHKLTMVKRREWRGLYT